MQGWKTAPEAIEQSGARLRRGLRVLVSQARQRLTGIERHELFRRPLDRVNQLRQLLDDRQRGLTLAVGERLRTQHRRVNDLGTRLEARHPIHRVRLLRERLSTLENYLRRAVESDRQRRELKLTGLAAQLQALGPENVLRRGYSLTTIKKTGVVVPVHTCSAWARPRSPVG